MSSAQRDDLGASALDRLAQRIRSTVREVCANEIPGVERFTVALLSPDLVLSQLDGDLSLEDGDPDFTIGATLRQRLDDGLVAVSDLVWVSRQDQEWHAFDVVSASS